jgi:hypothetical protein
MGSEIGAKLRKIAAEASKLKGAALHVGVQGAEHGQNYKASKDGRGAEPAESAAQASSPASLVAIARAHEYGAAISAKKGKYLTIPLIKEATRKSARQLQNLFVWENPDTGHVFLARLAKSKKASNVSKITKMLEKPGKAARKKPVAPKKASGAGKRAGAGVGGDAALELVYLLLPSVTIPERSFIRASFHKDKALIKGKIEEAVKGVATGGTSAEQALMSVGAWCVGSVKRFMPTVEPKKSALTLAPDPDFSTTLIHSGQLRNHVTFTIEGGG